MYNICLQNEALWITLYKQVSVQVEKILHHANINPMNTGLWVNSESTDIKKFWRHVVYYTDNFFFLPADVGY